MSPLKLFGRLLLGCLFLFSGYQKLRVPFENFEEVLRIYEIFPEPSIFFLSRFVPVLEVVLGFFLVLGFLTRLSLLGSSALFATFIFVISRGLLLGLPIEDCGCFGEALPLSPQITLGLDIFFLLLSLTLLFTKSSPLRLDSILFKKPES